MRLKATLEPARRSNPAADRRIRPSAATHSANSSAPTKGRCSSTTEAAPTSSTRLARSASSCASPARSRTSTAVGTPGDLVPGAVLQDHADHEDDVLELGRREGEEAASARRVEVGVLDGQVVVLRPVVAEDELVVGVHVHQPAARHVVAVEALDARDRRPGLDARTKPRRESTSVNERTSPRCTRRSRSLSPVAERSIAALLFQWQYRTPASSRWKPCCGSARAVERSADRSAAPRSPRRRS